MFSWSTDDLPPADRFDQWREERGRHLFGVTIELPPERRYHFRGRFSARQAGGAVLAALGASAYRVSRTAADIARVPKDSLVVGLQMAGPGWCDTPSGQTYVGAGSVAVGHTDIASRATPETSGDFLAHIVTIPLARIGVDGEAARRLHMAAIADPRLSLLLDAATHALFDTADDLAPDEADAAVDHVARLALLARGAVPARSPESRLALHAGYRQAALRLMRRNIHRPGLTPEDVARMLAISPRQLHVVFEPTGSSFHRTLTAMRIAMARRRLAARPDEAVIDLAFACGFDSLATFYRAFRRETGGTPRDFR